MNSDQYHLSAMAAGSGFFTLNAYLPSGPNLTLKPSLGEEAQAVADGVQRGRACPASWLCSAQTHFGYH